MREMDWGWGGNYVGNYFKHCGVGSFWRVRVCVEKSPESIIGVVVAKFSEVVWNSKSFS